VNITKVAQLIHDVRGRRVILDKDLAVLYGVTTGNLNKAVSRNAERFPADFMLALTPEEHRILRFQFGILRWGSHSKYAPRAFTQEGVAMLSGVLRSPRAVKVNIDIMRAFVRLRRALATGRDLPSRMKNAEAAINEHDRELTEHAVHLNQAFAEIRKLSRP
jgi:phage regulator Rha-like protein